MVDISTSMAAQSDRTIGNRSLVVTFCVTIFLSASLLFSVQPLFTKLILPLLGGSSGVWNTAMVFFQAVLLAGYIYAWAVSRWLGLRWQIVVHALVTLAGFAFLPLAVATGLGMPEGTMPTGWLLALFGASVGLPFFAISANAPLLQRWFSYTDHPDAEDPYFLYAVSNFGSLLVLCAYPVLIEPMLVLDSQTGLWSSGYRLLLLAIMAAGICAALRMRPDLDGRNADRLNSKSQTVAAPIAPRRIAFWILLAFIPSSLMLGTTYYLTNNIASAPFLWIIPLALFLLTFVIVFARKPIVSARRLMPAVPVVVVLTVLAAHLSSLHYITTIAVCIVAFFVIALAMHARLVEDRPDASQLTQFYIYMSLGGVLGGAFNALLAPVIFNGAHEFLLVLVLAALVVAPGQSLFTRSEPGRLVPVLAVCALIGAAALLLPKGGALWMGAVVVAVLALEAVLGRAGMARLPKFAVLLSVLIVGFAKGNDTDKVVFSDRSFYSTLKVEQSAEGDDTLHMFVHGNTVHNMQLRSDAKRHVPLAYYLFGNTFDHAVQASRRRVETPAVTVVGLGAGAMACHEQPGERWTYLEIDPAVVDMARDPSLFSYLADCAPNADVLTGDARFTIQKLAEGSQDLILVDAFTSDTVPTHLVTREAMRIYGSRLNEGGLMFFHTSNRTLDISSVVAATARAEGLTTRFIERKMSDLEGLENGKLGAPSTGLLVGTESAVLAATQGHAIWQHIDPAERVRPWTDDFSSIIAPMMAHSLKERRVRDIGTGN